MRWSSSSCGGADGRRKPIVTTEPGTPLMSGDTFSKGHGFSPSPRLSTSTPSTSATMSPVMMPLFCDGPSFRMDVTYRMDEFELVLNWMPTPVFPSRGESAWLPASWRPLSCGGGEACTQTTKARQQAAASSASRARGAAADARTRWAPSRYSRCDRCAPEMVESSSMPSSALIALFWRRGHAPGHGSAVATVSFPMGYRGAARRALTGVLVLGALVQPAAPSDSAGAGAAHEGAAAARHLVLGTQKVRSEQRAGAASLGPHASRRPRPAPVAAGKLCGAGGDSTRVRVRARRHGRAHTHDCAPARAHPRRAYCRKRCGSFSRASVPSPAGQRLSSSGISRGVARRIAIRLGACAVQ